MAPKNKKKEEEEEEKTKKKKNKTKKQLRCTTRVFDPFLLMKYSTGTSQVQSGWRERYIYLKGDSHNSNIQRMMGKIAFFEANMFCKCSIYVKIKH